jgi:hypothetical protein
MVTDDFDAYLLIETRLEFVQLACRPITFVSLFAMVHSSTHDVTGRL